MGLGHEGSLSMSVVISVASVAGCGSWSAARRPRGSA
jgi:hypothetical protein